MNVNKSLKNKISKLANENKELEGVVFNLKSLVKEKDEKVQELLVELDSTKKNLRMLNFGTTKLDQILNMRQSISNRNGLGYTTVANSVATTSKTMFVKASLTPTNHPVSGKNVRPSVLECKVKRFVLICHLRNMSGHIHSKCFKYKNTFRMNRVKRSYYKPRTAPKYKIDLKNKFVKKIWVKKN